MGKLIKIFAIVCIASAVVACSEKDTLGKARENLDLALDKYYECAKPAYEEHGNDWQPFCSTQAEEFKKANLHFKNNYTNEYMLDKQLFEEEFKKKRIEYSSCLRKARAEKRDTSICNEDPSGEVERFEFDYNARFIL